MRAPAPLLLIGLLGLGCAGAGDPAPPPAEEPTFEPAPVVVFVLVDTLADGYLGHHHPSWDVTPRVDDLLAESTVLENTLTVRGLTSVAVSSILTGVYPRHHFVRNNANRKRPEQPLLAERFHEAGYRTYGYAANVCQFIDEGIDDRYCTWPVEMPDPSMSLRVRDERLVEQLLARLTERPADEPAFIWLHLMHPHKPYLRVDPWYAEFHPEPYDGELGDQLDDQLDLSALGEIELDDADRAHALAVYASQVRETDRLISELFDGLEELGLWQDAVVVFGTDHGEELGEHHGYYWHSCSPYLPVNRVLFAVRAPGRVPAGQVLTDWVSVTDVAPSLIEVAGQGWSGERDGVSLVDGMRAGSLPVRPVYLERGEAAAGVVSDGYLFLRDEKLGYGDCMPYNQSTDELFPGKREELYDLASDPAQHEDLAEIEPQITEQLRNKLCGWVSEDVWMQNPDANDRNGLVQACDEVMGAAEGGGDEDPPPEEPSGCWLGRRTTPPGWAPRALLLTIAVAIVTRTRRR